MEAIVYFSALTGKQVKRGMRAQSTPSIVKREEYGFLEGTVTEVDLQYESSAVTPLIDNLLTARQTTPVIASAGDHYLKANQGLRDHIAEYRAELVQFYEKLTLFHLDYAAYAAALQTVQNALTNADLHLRQTAADVQQTAQQIQKPSTAVTAGLSRITAALALLDAQQQALAALRPVSADCGDSATTQATGRSPRSKRWHPVWLRWILAMQVTCPTRSPASSSKRSNG